MIGTITKSTIIAVFDVIFISILAFVLVKDFLKSFKNKMEYCKKRQDNLYETLLSLKKLIDMDKEKQDELIKNIKMLNKQFKKDKEEKEISEYNITFPHFTLFNDSNYEPNYNNGYRELRTDLYLLSYQLAKYLDKANGTCITFNELYVLILLDLDDYKKYRIDHTLINLLGIPENNYCDITLDELKNRIHTHLKKVN